MLEDYEFAKARGAKVFAEIVGFFASSNDTYHPIAPQPDGTGAARAMVAALADAGVTPDQIGHVQAHAASTPPEIWPKPERSIMSTASGRPRFR